VILLFAFKLIVAAVLVLFFAGIGIGLISWAVAEIKLRRHDREQADRWKPNADPFMGAP
jgi:hypothetical protein